MRILKRFRRYGGTVTLALLFIGLAGCVHSPTVREAADHGHPAGHMDQRSSDLEADIRLMWAVTAPSGDFEWLVAVPTAVPAAARVFETIDLRGLTRKQVAEKLRFDLRSPNYGYYAAFWPVARRDLPIRIDTGNYGWQFDIHFGTDQTVTGVTRRWIQ